MKQKYVYFALALIAIVAIVFLLPPDTDDWSMVYEAVQVPELECDDFGNCVPGDKKRFVLFNEDHLSRQECVDLFNEHLRRLNNNAAVIEYEISCKYLRTKGHGYLFQRQMYWLIG